MDWIIFLFILELGFAPSYTSLNVTEMSSDRYLSENVGYVQLDVEIMVLKTLFVGGSTKTYIQGTGKITDYFPFEVDYLLNAGARYKNFEIGFRHFCLHPVRPYEMYYQPQGSTDGSYEEFYIKFSNKEK